MSGDFVMSNEESYPRIKELESKLNEMAKLLEEIRKEQAKTFKPTNRRFPTYNEDTYLQLVNYLLYTACYPSMSVTRNLLRPIKALTEEQMKEGKIEPLESLNYRPDPLKKYVKPGKAEYNMLLLKYQNVRDQVHLFGENIYSKHLEEGYIDELISRYRLYMS